LRILEYLYWKRFGSGYFRAKHFPVYSNILKPSHSSYLSAYEDGTECSETSAHKIQMPRNYPEESIQQFRKFFDIFIMSLSVPCT